MSTVQIKATERTVYERGRGEYEPDEVRHVAVCEVWIGGVRFSTDCTSRNEAMQLAYLTARALGLPIGCVIEC